MSPDKKTITKYTKPAITSLIMLAVTIVSISMIFSTEPKAQKDGATKKTPMLVETIAANVAEHTPLIRAYGVVKPSQMIDLRPRVGGEVSFVAANFVPGNLVKKGELLIKLDPTDYQLILQRAQAELTRAESVYQIEQGEQIRAQKAFDLVSSSVSGANKALILREPQKKQAEANLLIARSNVTDAELALQRTRIKMPFDGQIISRRANLGSQLSPNEMLAEIIGTDSYWIEANIPLSKLTWLAPPTDENSVPNVIIRNKTALQDNHSIRGKLIQVISTLDESSRMARVLIEVKDPLGLRETGGAMSANPLIAGTYVETDLPAKSIPSSVKLPVEYLRKRNTVWVLNDDKLDIRSVTVAFKDETHSYITEGLADGDQIIITDISAVRQGASVQLKSETSANGMAE